MVDSYPEWDLAVYRVALICNIYVQYHGRIQDFKLGEGALKKIAPSGGRRENCWGISSEKSRFYAKKSILGEGARRVRPPGSAPEYGSKATIAIL